MRRPLSYGPSELWSLQAPDYDGIYYTILEMYIEPNSGLQAVDLAILYLVS
jgi:hypothetical protein